ncbi:hypothetical protein ACQKWADRAFT_49628 [Trichoderma austrokoningii]
MPSVVPERLTGQLYSGVCLEAEMSAGILFAERGLSQGNEVGRKKSRNKNRPKTDRRSTNEEPVRRQSAVLRERGASIKPQKRGGLRPCVTRGHHFTVCAGN